MRSLFYALSLCCLPFAVRAADASDLQQQIDALRSDVQALQAAAVSPSAAAAPIPAPAAADRPFKTSRRAAVDEAAAQDASQGLQVKLSLVAIYQNRIGAGDQAADASGNTHSANLGAGSATADLLINAQPLSNAQAFVDFSTSSGPGLASLLPSDPSLDAVDNADSQTAVREAWLEFSTPHKHALLRAGLLDAASSFDSNAAANDESSQFLTSALVNSPLLASPAPGPGALVRMDEGAWEGSVGAYNTTQSFKQPSDAAYAIAELGLHYDYKGPAHWRLWARQQPRGDGQPDQAMGLSVDHRFGNVLTFWRYAKSAYVEDYTPASQTAPESRVAANLYNWAASGGFELDRPDLTHYGLAYGRNAEQSGNLDDFAEIYHYRPLGQHLILSSHYQAIFNRVRGALGSDALPTIHTLGFRVTVNY